MRDNRVRARIGSAAVAILVLTPLGGTASAKVQDPSQLPWPAPTFSSAHFTHPERLMLNTVWMHLDAVGRDRTHAGIWKLLEPVACLYDESGAPIGPDRNFDAALAKSKLFRGNSGAMNPWPIGRSEEVVARISTQAGAAPKLRVVRVAVSRFCDEVARGHHLDRDRGRAGGEYVLSAPVIDGEGWRITFARRGGVLLIRRMELLQGHRPYVTEDNRGWH